jgi:hypothetical protein
VTNSIRYVGTVRHSRPAKHATGPARGSRPASPQRLDPPEASGNPPPQRHRIRPAKAARRKMRTNAPRLSVRPSLDLTRDRQAPKQGSVDTFWPCTADIAGLGTQWRHRSPCPSSSGGSGQGRSIPGGLALSRTDADAPFWVRLARAELAAEALHVRDHVACDLPQRPPTARPPWLPATKCHWMFRYTGTAVCSCSMCHAGPQHRQENRDQRHRDRVILRAALRRWNHGDDAAFDDLVPSARVHYW